MQFLGAHGRATSVLALTILAMLLTEARDLAQELIARTESGVPVSEMDHPGSQIFVAEGFRNGFRPGTQTLGFNLGAGAGVAAFGSEQAHDLAWAGIVYGVMLGGVTTQDHWYRGNFELRGEFLGGAEFSPDTEWLIALTPHLRYNFATRTRWVPFLDVGVGVSATGIGPPDLSHTFEFNLQAAVGTHYFLKENLAITADARYLHMSCAGISHPNQGLNTIMGTMGMTWLF